MSNMSNLVPPTELSLSGNIAENWLRWKQRFQFYVKAIGLDVSKHEERVVSLLLTCLGEPGIDIFNSFTFSDEKDKDKYDEVIKRFDEHYIPKKNITFFRHQFFTRNQLEGESVEQFVTDLKNKAKDCEFGTLKEDLIKDRLVCGLVNPQLKERLLRDGTLTLSKAVEICQVAEISLQQMRVLEDNLQHKPNNTSVHAVKTQPQTSKMNFGVPVNRPKQFTSRPNQQTTKNRQFKLNQNSGRPKQNNSGKPCSKCGTIHAFKHCPAFGATCFKCNKFNHFARMCYVGKQVHSVVEKVGLSQNLSDPVGPSNSILEHNSVDTGNMFVGTVQVKIDKIDSEVEPTKDWWIELCVKNEKFSVKLDTGAQANVMSKTLFLKLGFSLSILKPSPVNICTFSGEKMVTLGKCFLNCRYRDQRYKLYFYVVQHDCDPIIGLSTCVKLNVIKKIDGLVQNEKPGLSINNSVVSLSEFSDLFDGSVGCVPQQCKIVLKDNAVPVVSTARRIPLALEAKVKIKLMEMESMGIVQKVNEPTDWVSPIVIVHKKDGDIRICLDPKHLNDNIKLCQYQLPTIDMLSSKLVGAKHFSVLDANAGFWMVPLTEDSSFLCTFSTPFGRYRFRRLPFGIKCAPEIFHKIVVQTFDGLPGVESYLDDIVIWGSSKKEHDERLRNVLSRARESGFKFNPNKCKFSVSEIKYLGHIFSDKGVSIDKDKVESIKNMPAPTCKKELERFLGMTNYLSKFIPNYSEKSVTLRQLLKNDTVWDWNESFNQAFVKLKNSLCNTPVLGYFDTNQPVTLSVDSSREGLGAVILQNQKPIAYASKCLNQAQKNYAQIELEMLAICFGCERFHSFVYGREVFVESDHKPLEAIFKKPLDKVPMRLQRMLLRVQAYNLTVAYKPGRYLYIADTLSRAPSNINSKVEKDVFDEDLDVQVNSLVSNLPISENQLNNFLNETKKDSVLTKLHEYIVNGWPRCKSHVEESVKPFWTYKDDLSIMEGIVFKNDKLVVPRSLQKEMLSRIHTGHLGIERCKSRAREVLFWPGMSSQITDVVTSCFVCQKHRNSLSKEPLMSHELPTLPWEKVASDLFMLNDNVYLLVVDYYSNYVEISLMPNSTSATIITHLKSIFARHGIPKIFISDNGTQYVSQLFKEFVSKWDICHVTSSPYHPKSNGLAERSVQTVKQLLVKCQESNDDPYLALLSLRTTPRGMLPSPAEALMGRRLNTNLPMSNKLLQPKCIRSNYRKLLSNNRYQSKLYYDRSSKPLSKLSAGDSVMFQKFPKSSWSPGYVKNLAQEPRSYVVEDRIGNTYRRNRASLNPNIQDKSNIETVKSPHCNVGLSQRSPVVSPKSRPNDVSNICEEEEVVKNFDGYVTSKGRVVTNPKRLTFSPRNK
jgi:transposase InsO family protein